MWRAAREIVLSFVAVLLCAAFLAVLVQGYDRFVPTSARREEQAKDVPQKTEPKPVEPMRDVLPAPVQRKPPGGFRGFGKKTRMQTLSERLGVRLETPSEDLMVQLGLPEGEGLSVGEVRENSAAAGAGMKIGDVLVELGGRTVPGEPGQFDFQLGDLKAGEPLGAVILREGKMETLKGLVLPEATPRPFFQFWRKPPPIQP